VASGALDLSSPLTEQRDLLDPYVPRILLRQLVEAPGERFHSVDATVVFADISGFTKLSERLARNGREGAEELVETIGTCFGSLLAVAYDNGGSLLKFGGDALLLLFEGDDHAARACSSAIGMRRGLRDAGRLVTSAGKVTLRMSQGVHSGEFHLFLVGESHRELLITGPAASMVVAMEKAADAGEVLISTATAARLPARVAGSSKGRGLLLASAPAASPVPDNEPKRRPPVEEVAACLSTAVREHLASGQQPAEHRNVTAAFVRFEGTDALVAREGPGAAAAALDELVTIVQRAVDEQEVCFLESDVDFDGGKLMLTAGAPRIMGDDEERMLLALRRIVDAKPSLRVRVGANRGGGVLRRRRAVPPPQLQRDGRHREPRRTARRDGSYGRDIRNRGRAGAIGDPLRPRRARAVRGEGQGAPDPCLVGRAGSRQPRARRGHRALAAHRARARARGARGRARPGARRPRAAGRDRR